MATLLREHGEGEIAQAVALLHDVVEDTPVTIEEIEAVFAAAVSRRVALLTDEPAVPGRNRAARKAATRLRLSQADAITQSVKLADLIDNSVSIVAYDPQFARIFLREMRELVEVLDRGNPRLRDLAFERSVGQSALD